MVGGTGTIGRATVRALVARGHEVVCLVRRSAEAARIPEGAVARG
ncbi:NAD(P)H-binding protein, partial [Methylobacterium sp. WL103]